MNQIDKLELLANVSALRREAKELLADSAGAGHAARLRRILLILSYMREHLEMVAMGPRDEGSARGLADSGSPSVDERREISDLP